MPLSKELEINWLKSDNLFGQAVLFSLYGELDEATKNDKTVSPFDVFWKLLQEFSLKSLKPKKELLLKH